MPSINSVNILVALFLLVSGNKRRSSPLFSFSLSTALSLSLSFVCLSAGHRHIPSSVWGFAIGVNGLGRMKRCVPLSDTAICFMGDQCAA